MKPIDESYLAWIKERKEPFTSEETMDEIIKQLGDKWPFKYHYSEA